MSFAIPIPMGESFRQTVQKNKFMIRNQAIGENKLSNRKNMKSKNLKNKREKCNFTHFMIIVDVEHTVTKSISAFIVAADILNYVSIIY